MAESVHDILARCDKNALARARLNKLAGNRAAFQIARADYEAIRAHIAQLEAKVAAPTGQGDVERWQPISDAPNLMRDAIGVSRPCAVLLALDVTRPGPFIRQGRFDVCAGAFVCDTTGHTLRDAVAFAKPDWSFGQQQEGQG